MEPDDLLCSRNARPEKGGRGSHQTILLARRTHTMKLCSSDARSEGQSGDSLGREGVMVQKRKQKALAWANGTSRVPVGGWVRKLRAVEDQSAPIPEEITSELGRIIYIVGYAHSRIDQATLERK